MGHMSSLDADARALEQVDGQSKLNREARAETERILSSHRPPKTLEEEFGAAEAARMRREAAELHGEEGLMND